MHDVTCRERFRDWLSHSERGQRVLDNAAARLRVEPTLLFDKQKEEHGHEMDVEGKLRGEDDEGQQEEGVEGVFSEIDEVPTEAASKDDEGMQELCAVDCMELYSPVRVSQ